MSAALLLRDDFDGPRPSWIGEGIARDPIQLRRLLALTEIYDGVGGGAGYSRGVFSGRGP